MHEKRGSNKLNSGPCPKVYVGQTDRNFEKHICEDYIFFANAIFYSNYAEHLIEKKTMFV